MKKFIKILIYESSFAYLLGSFYNVSFDIKKWTIESRGTTVFLYIIVLIILTMIAALIEDSKPKN